MNEIRKKAVGYSQNYEKCGIEDPNKAKAHNSNCKGGSCNGQRSLITNNNSKMSKNQKDIAKQEKNLYELRNILLSKKRQVSTAIERNISKTNSLFLLLFIMIVLIMILTYFLLSN